MGRARKVDRDTARESALSAFWVNGYSGLGVRKLEELTGINRFALQTEFGGKGGLFLKIAAAYISNWNISYGDGLRNGDLEDLAAYFLARTNKNLRTETNNGCLIFNTLGNDQPDAPEIHEVVLHFLDTVQDSFAAAIRNERTQGTLVKGLDIDKASQMLLTSLIGMNQLIRINGNNAAARPTALGLKAIIMNWRIPT